MSCQHGNWPPCELCDELEAAYELGRKSVLVADGGERVELIELLLTLRDKFQDINLDDDGDNYMNDSCDGMDLIDAALAKFQPAGGENDG